MAPQLDSRNFPVLLESIQDILCTTLYTACVGRAVPVSLLLVSDSGSAKSKLVKALTCENIHMTDSISSAGLFDLMAKDAQNKVRWITMQDFNPTLSRRPGTVNSTVANLLTLTMDGTCRVDDGRQQKVAVHNPVGLITAMTPEMFQRQGRKWFALGLSRRIIPVFYEYSANAVREMLRAVREGKISGSDFPSVHVDISKTLEPEVGESESAQIETLGVMFSTNLGLARSKNSDGQVKWFVRKILPISPTVVLRTLAQANAIRHKRNHVSNEDLQFVANFVDFTNVSRPKVI